MNIWYALVKRWIAAGLSIYFRRISVHGLENIPGGAVMFTVNHQNALLDALLIATTNQRSTHFLVRADVFKSRVARLFFNSLNMMPIYRIRDGRESLSKNHLIFKRCTRILSHNEAIMVFPEGNHHQNRRLLSLSKGFTRIIANAGKENISLRIIPVGINYSHHRLFGGSVAIFYGKPLEFQNFSPDDHISSLDLRNRVASSMKILITHIPKGSNFKVLEQYLNANPWNYLDPARCNAWVAKNTHQIIGTPPKHSQLSPFWQILKVLSYWLHWPVMYVYRNLLNKLGDPVFTSSVKFLVGVIITPVYYLLLGSLTAYWFGLPGAMAIIILCMGLMFLRKRSLAYQYPDTKEGIKT